MGSRFDADLQFTLCGSGNDRLFQQRDDGYRLSKGRLRNLNQMSVMREKQDLCLTDNWRRTSNPAAARASSKLMN